METPPESWSDEAMSETTHPEAEEAHEAPEPTEPPGGDAGAPPPNPDPVEQGRRLERIEDGRWIAGVSTGLADYFAVPVWLVRVIFVLLLGPAGIGLFLYLGLIVFMPHESEAYAPAERWFGDLDSPSRWGGALIAVVGGLALLAVLTDVDGGVVVALAVLAVGVLLFQSSTRSGAPRQAAEGSAEVPATAVDPGDTSSGGGGTPPRAPRPPREPRPPRPPRERRPREKSNLGAFTIAGTLIALGLLGSADIAGWLFPEAVHYFAVAVLGVGLGLLVGTWFGRSRGLILLGIALLFPLAGTFAVANADVIVSEWADDAQFDSPRTIVIDEVTGVDRVDIGVGEVTVDAREAVWSEDGGDDARLILDVGAAELTVLLPDDVDLYAEIGVGEIVRNGNVVASGLAVSYESGDDDGPFVWIDQGVGEIRIEGGER